MKRKSTIRDVAKKAGMSLSTVSLVINDKENVSVETRRRVNEIISELGYHPQRSARGLASQSSGNIGFILTEDHFSHAEPFYTRIFLGAEFEARKHNYYILLTTVGLTIKATKELPRFLLEHNVDGVIIAGKISASWIDFIAERNIPLLLIDYDLPRYNLSSVGIDNRTGAKLAVAHLRRGGHTKIGFIGGDIHHPSINHRYTAYRDTLQGMGIELSSTWIDIDEPNTRMVDGYEAGKKIFSHNSNRPTAIFAANDAMALGCMKYLKEAGLKIPNDVAIVGFDNVEAGLPVEPRLTTVNVHREEMGCVAIRRMAEMIRDKSQVVTKTVTPVELVVRESCGVTKESFAAD
jgi:LacI family transcriptional regulator